MMGKLQLARSREVMMHQQSRSRRTIDQPRKTTWLGYQMQDRLTSRLKRKKRLKGDRSRIQGEKGEAQMEKGAKMAGAE